MMKIDI
jgi:hypothetical protein